MTPERTLGAIVLAIASGSLMAAERRIEFAPWVGVRSGASLAPGSSVTAGAEADPSPSLGLSVAWWLKPDRWVEVFFDRQALHFEPLDGSDASPFDISVDYLQFGGGYEPPGDGLRPYVTVALGLGRYGADPGSVSRSLGLSGSIGGGFEVPIGRKALLRLEARGWSMLTSASTAVVCGPGCSFAFSGEGWWQVGARAAVVFRPTGARKPADSRPRGRRRRLRTDRVERRTSSSSSRSPHSLDPWAEAPGRSARPVPRSTRASSSPPPAPLPSVRSTGEGTTSARRDGFRNRLC